MKNLILICLAFLTVDAIASVVIGNPTTVIEVVSGSDVAVDSLELFACRGSSSTVVVVNTTLDQGETASVVLPAGSWCDVEVTLRWSPLAALGTIPVTGFTRLDILASGATRTIELDEPSGSAQLPGS